MMSHRTSFTIGTILGLCFLFATGNALSLGLKEIKLLESLIDQSDGDVFKRSEECSNICPENVTVPNCGKLRMAPNYDRNCDCLLEYRCCSENCTKPKSSCDEGYFPVDEVDCCDCPVVRCEPCPTISLPACSRTECEAIFYEPDSLGCKEPVCRQSCPLRESLQCPDCHMEETFVNDTLCGCADQRCVQKPCAIPVKPDPMPCHVLTNSTDKCGCLEYNSDRGPFCDPYNKIVRDAVCVDPDLPGRCLEKRVKEGATECGCDSNECITVETCKEEYDDDDCPKGHFMLSGLSQCGRSRDVCVKCPNVNVDERSCPLACNHVFESKDSHGCLTKICRKKACKECPYGYDEKEDDCGCKTCFAIPEFIIQRRTVTDVANMQWSWQQYEEGHRDANAYWAGLKMIYQITNSSEVGTYQLVFRLKKPDSKWAELVLDDFYLGPSDDMYRIHYGKIYSQANMQAIQSRFDYHNGRQFGTHDRPSLEPTPLDHLKRNSQICPGDFKAGWWFGHCFYFCLNCKQSYQYLWNIGGSVFTTTETEMSIRRKP